MKISVYIFLFLFLSINSLQASQYTLVLNDAKSTLDGTTLSSTEVNGVTYEDAVVKLQMKEPMYFPGP